MSWSPFLLLVPVAEPFFVLPRSTRRQSSTSLGLPHSSLLFTNSVFPPLFGSRFPSTSPRRPPRFTSLPPTHFFFPHLHSSFASLLSFFCPSFRSPCLLYLFLFSGVVGRRKEEQGKVMVRDDYFSLSPLSLILWRYDLIVREWEGKQGYPSGLRTIVGGRRSKGGGMKREEETRSKQDWRRPFGRLSLLTLTNSSLTVI